jgi:hypothetical protein
MDELLVLADGRLSDPESESSAVKEESNGVAHLLRLLLEDHGTVLEIQSKCYENQGSKVLVLKVVRAVLAHRQGRHLPRALRFLGAPNSLMCLKIEFWAQKNKFYSFDALDEASNFLQNKKPMEQSYNSWAH